MLHLIKEAIMANKHVRELAIRAITNYFKGKYVEVDDSGLAFDVRVYTKKGGKELVFFGYDSIKENNVVGKYSSGQDDIEIPLS